MWRDVRVDEGLRTIALLGVLGLLVGCMYCDWIVTIDPDARAEMWASSGDSASFREELCESEVEFCSKEERATIDGDERWRCDPACK